MTDARQIRTLNYAIKHERGFQCAECEADDRILVVTEKATGNLTTRCEHCLDKRSFDVRPYQFDEAERRRAAA